MSSAVMSSPAPLAGQVALVTGASRGIGRAIALELAAAGAQVVVNYASSPDAAEAVVAEITAAGGEAWSHRADVADEEQVDAMVKAVLARGGRLDVLVNNAGITRDGLLMRMKTADWQSVINLNLTGVFLCTRAVSRAMLKARGGRIINITSVVALMGNPGQANYSAAKAGVIGLTRSNAAEFAARGCHRQCRCPRLHRERHDRRTRQGSRSWRRFPWGGWAAPPRWPVQCAFWPPTRLPPTSPARCCRWMAAW